MTIPFKPRVELSISNLESLAVDYTEEEWEALKDRYAHQPDMATKGPEAIYGKFVPPK